VFGCPNLQFIGNNSSHSLITTYNELLVFYLFPLASGNSISHNYFQVRVGQKIIILKNVEGRCEHQPLLSGVYQIWQPEMPGFPKSLVTFF
jgi:hypothetical protein